MMSPPVRDTRSIRDRPHHGHGFLLHATRAELSASTVRMVGRSKANLFASIAARHALWGPLHGGANQAS